MPHHHHHRLLYRTTMTVIIIPYFIAPFIYLVVRNVIYPNVIIEYASYVLNWSKRIDIGHRPRHIRIRGWHIYPSPIITKICVLFAISPPKESVPSVNNSFVVVIINDCIIPLLGIPNRPGKVTTITIHNVLPPPPKVNKLKYDTTSIQHL